MGVESLLDIGIEEEDDLPRPNYDVGIAVSKYVHPSDQCITKVSAEVLLQRNDSNKCSLGTYLILLADRFLDSFPMIKSHGTYIPARLPGCLLQLRKLV